MIRRVLLTVLMLMGGELGVSCVPAQSASTPVSNMPNPAAVYCEQQGGKPEIVTAAGGSQSGLCIFPDGSQCNEWAFFRGECGPSGLAPESTDEIVNGWRTYRNELSGYCFQYPAGAEIIMVDNPLKSLLISGPGMENETWSISHPSDREEYRPPEGVDLLQWLTDHYLLGEKRMPDTQIAGTPAIQFRHERSAQSPAGDRYSYQGQLAKLMSDNCFVVYILHLLIIIWLALALRGVRLNLGIKFLLVAPSAMVLCYLVAYLIRKIPFVRSIL